MNRPDRELERVLGDYAESFHGTFRNELLDRQFPVA